MDEQFLVSRDREHGADEELLASLSNANSSVDRSLFVEKRHRYANDTLELTGAGNGRRELPELEDVLVSALSTVVQELLAAFHAAQVQSVLASGIQPAKFELEMVQHRPGLELLVTTAGPTGAVLVTFLLPLFAEQAAWSPRSVCAVDDASLVYFPDAFYHANFDDVEADRSEMTLSIVYMLPDTHSEHTSRSWRPVSTAVQWPSSLRLSQQVVQMPLPSQELSCVEALSYCKQSFATQWTKRKQFIRELRKSVVVLEYDAVDFSRVFFMLQEQPGELSTQLAPLVLEIVVVSLEFTPAYFLTWCPSDLRVTLLDGGDESDRSDAVPVELPLTPSASVEAAGEWSVEGLVREVIVQVRSALVKHLNPTL